MIIDEVHNLREEKDSTEDEDDKEKALKNKKERENARTILKKSCQIQSKYETNNYVSNTNV